MKVNCPQCKKQVIWGPESPYRPFCSKRCQLIDLGEWSEERHVIQGNSQSQNNKPTDIDIEEIEAMLAKQSNDFFNPN